MIDYSTSDLTAIYKKMASALNKRVKQLTRAERNQAVVNEIIRKGADTINKLTT